MDDDKNRKLCFDEFHKGVNEYNLNFTKEEIRQIFNEFDVNHDGSVDYEEFLRKLRVCFFSYKRIYSYAVYQHSSPQ